MKNSKIVIAAILVGMLAFMGFQCSSTEITSAKLYIQQKNYDKALDVLEKEVAKNPKSDEGLYLLGYVNGEKGNYPQMVDAYNKSLGISKTFEKNINDSKKYFWATLFNKGVSYYQKGNKAVGEDSSNIFYAQSISDFENAIKIEPDSADTYKNLAFVYLSKGDNEEAIKPLEKLLSLNKSVDAYRFLGEIYYVSAINLKSQDKKDEANVNFEKALIVLKEGIAAYPDDQEISLTLSNTLVQMGKEAEAVSLFKKAVDNNPEDKYNRYNYGVVLLGINEFENAEEQFLKALEIDPEYNNAIYNIGVTYLKWGTYMNKKAEEEGKISTEYLEKYRKALPHLEKAVQYEKADATIWETLARVYSVLGMNDDAANAFKKADELRGN